MHAPSCGLLGSTLRATRHVYHRLRHRRIHPEIVTGRAEQTLTAIRSDTLPGPRANLVYATVAHQQATA
jgi:hypothetical protein